MLMWNCVAVFPKYCIFYWKRNRLGKLCLLNDKNKCTLLPMDLSKALDFCIIWLVYGHMGSSSRSVQCYIGISGPSHLQRETAGNWLTNPVWPITFLPETDLNISRWQNVYLILQPDLYTNPTEFLADTLFYLFIYIYYNSSGVFKLSKQRDIFFWFQTLDRL